MSPAAASGDGDLALSRLIDRLYETATDPEGWKACLDIVSEATGSLGTMFWSVGESASPIVSEPLRDAHRLYASKWRPQDPFMAAAATVPGLTGVVLDSHFDDRIDRSSHPFFQEFLAPQGLGAFAAYFSPPIFGARFVLITQRRLGDGTFAAGELERFEVLAPQAARALAIAGQLTLANTRDTALLSLMDKMHYGAVIVSRDVKVVSMNEAATRMLDDGLAVSDGTLVETFSNTRGSLAQMVRLAFDDASGNRNALIHRPSGRKPIVLQVLSFPKTVMSWGTLQRGATALVMLIDTEAGGTLGQMSVFQSFGLTSAEAKVATLVGYGISPIEAAEQLGSAAGTVRVQLKNVFNKLDIKRQSELVRLMAKLEVLGS